MLKVEDYGIIRRAHRDSMSIRAIARQLHHSRRKVRDALASPEPQPYTRTKEREAPKLGRFKPVIDQILADDEQAPPKQRHTAMQVFRRLRGLPHSGVYRNWQLPAAFTQLRAALEERHGVHAGSRQYIRVLQLLAEHPQGRVQQAIEYCRTRNLLDAELIRSQAEHLALRQEPAGPEVCAQTFIPEIQVPRADLSRFNQLLSIGEPAHA
jgi:hypothetical protein